MTTQTTPDAALSAIRVIRMAWFDEKLDAEARGDAVAAARASRELTECELTLRKLEQRRDTPPLRSLLGLVRRA
jgi:hypothetical protein